MREESIDNSCFQAFLVAACETHLRPHSIKRPHNRPAAGCLDWQHHAVSRHGIQTLDSELMLCGAASGDPQTVDWRSFLIGGLQPFASVLIEVLAARPVGSDKYLVFNQHQESSHCAHAHKLLDCSHIHQQHSTASTAQPARISSELSARRR